MELKNSNVVVTGGSSGIGLELVKQLLDGGCNVVTASRSINKIPLMNERLHLFSCDLSAPEGIDSLFSHALETLGNIDIFIANAGFAYYEKLGEPDWEHIYSILNINFNSVVYSAQKMKSLSKNLPYNFVAVASGMSILPLPGYALYGSTKAAIHNFAGSYRWELEKGQHFQVVYPIATRTEFFENAGGSPVPWPSQGVSRVCASIVSGIRKNCKSIYPSKLFYLMHLTNRLIPAVFSFYSRMQYKKFKNFFNESKGGK